MIGNDIVDLYLAEKESNWQREGFLEKQFTKNERQLILDSDNPFFTVWLFWSMKEAAYKCYTQKVEKRFFAPQKFECKFTLENGGMVTFENQKFYTSSDSDYYIHTTAEDVLVENVRKTRIYAGVCLPLSIDKSIKKRLEEHLGIPYLEIEKRKTSIGAPLFYYQEKQLTSSCSISHHGNYGAYAFKI